jgi:hypothetical protein
MRTVLLLVALGALATVVHGVSLPALKSKLVLEAASGAEDTHPLSGIHAHFIPLVQHERTEAEEVEYFDKLEEHHDLLHEGQNRRPHRSNAQNVIEVETWIEMLT